MIFVILFVVGVLLTLSWYVMRAWKIGDGDDDLGAASTIYQIAKENLGRQLTLDPSVPSEVGCAQAVSWILVNSGYKLPKGGISTVLGLNKWLLANGFVEVTSQQVGAIISSRRKDGQYAHIGVCGKTHIMSNTSYTNTAKGLFKGMWQANFTYEGWDAYYVKNGADKRFFVPTTSCGQ